MTYDVGTHIDLSHLNKTSKAEVTPSKSPFEAHIEQAEAETSHQYETGTQIIFRWTKEGLKSAVRIPVLAV